MIQNKMIQTSRSVRTDMKEISPYCHKKPPKRIPSIGVLMSEKAGIIISAIFVVLVISGGGFLLTSSLEMSKNTGILQANSEEQPTPHFHVTLVAPTNDPDRVQISQVVKSELWKIGIGADLVLVGWDLGLNYTVFELPGGKDIDIAFIDSNDDGLTTNNLVQTYHSSTSLSGLNSSELDTLLEKIQAEPDNDTRRELVIQALDYIVWKFHPGTGIVQANETSVQSMIYTTRNTHLQNVFVRLAISHTVPRQEEVLKDQGILNEIMGLAFENPYYPNETEWNSLGLNESENVNNLKFQGHIDYNLEKAWALMEKAGYNMDKWRELLTKKDSNSDKIPGFAYPILIVLTGLGVIRCFRRINKRS